MGYNPLPLEDDVSASQEQLRNLTFRGKIAQSSGTVALNLGARRVGQRYEDFAYAHLQKLRLEVV